MFGTQQNFLSCLFWILLIRSSSSAIETCYDVWNSFTNAERADSLPMKTDKYTLTNSDVIRCGFVDLGDDLVFIGAMSEYGSLSAMLSTNQCPMYESCPYNEYDLESGETNKLYRWSLSRMTSYRTDAISPSFDAQPYLLMTCNMDLSLTQDYMLLPFDEDFVTTSFNAACYQIKEANIRGYECENDVGNFWNYGVYHFHMDSYHCVCGGCCSWNTGALSSEDNFGWYGNNANPLFSCAADSTSTTEYWIGSIVNAPEFVCENATHFVWEDLLQSGTGKPNAVANLSVDDATLTLNIEIEADYVGNSAADDNGYLYGTTYVIDFEDFDAHQDSIQLPGNCANRAESSFSDTTLTWEDVWRYSVTPNTDGHVGSDDYLAYPPGNKWTVAMAEGDPCSVTYSASLTWSQLTSCTNYDGSNGLYITTSDNAKNITLSGTLYINVVSPYDYAADYGFYRIYQLLSQPFMIVVSKTTYVLGEVGINLLTMDIIGVFKEDEENIFRLIVLTESAEYLRLSRDDLSEDYLQVFSASDPLNEVTSAKFRTLTTAETAGVGCLGNKAYICSQLWQITADDVECSTGGIFTDFSGTYSIQFTPECRSALELGDTDLFDYCVQWLSDHEDEITDSTAGDKVLLSADLIWRDEICDPEIFRVQFAATMQFYTDEDYLNEVADPSTGHLFQVGEDTIYVKVTTDYPTNTFSVFDTELLNVWICTFDPLVSVDAIDVASGSGGCFDPDRDDNNGSFIEHVYENGVAQDGFALDTSTTTLESNEIQFSLVVPDKVSRDTLYIHAQIEVSLGAARRRMIIEAQVAQKHANQMEHFVDRVGIKSAPRDKPQPPVVPHQPPPPQAPVLPAPSTWVIPFQSPWFIAIVCVLALMLTINAMFMCYVNCVKPNRVTRYSPIKAVDSSDFSENDVLNVISD